MVASVRAIVTDIEGTTSSIAFVADVLFPYAKAHLRDFVEAHPQEVAPLLDEVRAAEPGDPVDVLLRWIDEDRKATPLKTLQGLIWAEGYADGILSGHIYSDAAEALGRWHTYGLQLYVYSSGSIAAQKLIFGHSDFGDLTPLFSGYFDTGVGGKKEAGAYRAIAQAIGVAPGEILFLSDIAAELQAAREAGFAVTLLAREGAPADTSFPVATSFDSIETAETLA